MQAKNRTHRGELVTPLGNKGYMNKDHAKYKAYALLNKAYALLNAV